VGNLLLGGQGLQEGTVEVSRQNSRGQPAARLWSRGVLSCRRPRAQKPAGVGADLKPSMVCSESQCRMSNPAACSNHSHTCARSVPASSKAWYSWVVGASLMRRASPSTCAQRHTIKKGWKQKGE
jgi:hypothetical protein